MSQTLPEYSDLGPVYERISHGARGTVDDRWYSNAGNYLPVRLCQAVFQDRDAWISHISPHPA